MEDFKFDMEEEFNWSWESFFIGVVLSLIVVVSYWGLIKLGGM